MALDPYPQVAMDPPQASTTPTLNGGPPSYAPHPNGDYHTLAAATATAALSQQHTPTPNNAAAGNTRKRKASGAPGSRGVANLTPEQLAKKRANDREAQRAIRERTKNTIEALERRIRELEGQQPFQELQRVVQERDRALQECEDLRRRLGAVAGIVGAQHPSLNELAALTAQQSPMPPVQHSGSPHAPPQAQMYDQQQHLHVHPDLQSPQSASGSPSPHVQTPNQPFQDGEDALRKWSSSNQQFATSNPSPPYDSRPPVSMQSESNGERLGVNFLLESKQQPSHSSPVDPAQQLPPTPDSPTWARTTNVGPPSCPLDAVLLDFHRSRRKLLQDGASVSEVLGPLYPDWTALMNGTPASHPVSSLLIDILSKFPDIANLPEKVSVLYIMFLVLRWLICPDRENYERLPDWVRPVPEQWERSHVAWCDYLPWPGMRKAITLRGTEVRFEDFFIPYTTTLSLSWGYGDDNVLISGDEGPFRMNPVFEAHLRILDNWRLGGDFQRAFPDLVDGVRFNGDSASQ